MNILHLVTTPWWNASAYYAITTAYGLHQKGHHIIVAGSNGIPAVEKAQQLGLTIFSNIHLESFNPYHFVRNIMTLKDFISKNKIDLVHAHQPEAHFFGAFATQTNLPRIPLVRSVSDVRSPAKNIFNKKLHLQYTDGFIFSSQSSIERYQKIFDLESKVTERILAGLDFENFIKPTHPKDYRQQLGVPDNHQLVGLIARLSPEKGLFHFLTASKYVLEKIKNVTFLISGEKIQISHQELKEYARHLGIEKHIILLDRVEPVQDLIHEIDIGVVSSVGSEAVCRIAAEFMAYGKPVVATDVNVLPEMIKNGENGFITDRNDPRAMAEAIGRVLRDDHLFSRMSRNNRKKIKNELSLEKFSGQTEMVYQKVFTKFRQTK